VLIEVGRSVMINVLDSAVQPYIAIILGLCLLAINNNLILLLPIIIINILLQYIVEKLALALDRHK
jgi:hypothetical protein